MTLKRSWSKASFIKITWKVCREMDAKDTGWDGMNVPPSYIWKSTECMPVYRKFRNLMNRQKSLTGVLSHLHLPRKETFPCGALRLLLFTLLELSLGFLLYSWPCSGFSDQAFCCLVEKMWRTLRKLKNHLIPCFLSSKTESPAVSFQSALKSRVTPPSPQFLRYHKTSSGFYPHDLLTLTAVPSNNQLLDLSWFLASPFWVWCSSGSQPPQISLFLLPTEIITIIK